MLSAVMLLDWVTGRGGDPGFGLASKAIESAIDTALQNPATRTGDLGGEMGTADFARHIASLL